MSGEHKSACTPSPVSILSKMSVYLKSPDTIQIVYVYRHTAGYFTPFMKTCPQAFGSRKRKTITEDNAVTRP